MKHDDTQWLIDQHNEHMVKSVSLGPYLYQQVWYYRPLLFSIGDPASPRCILRVWGRKQWAYTPVLYHSPRTIQRHLQRTLDDWALYHGYDRRALDWKLHFDCNSLISNEVLAYPAGKERFTLSYWEIRSLSVSKEDA
jgi:hypothetical protein